MVYKEVHRPAYLRIYDECVVCVKKNKIKEISRDGREKNDPPEVICFTFTSDILVIGPFN